MLLAVIMTSVCLDGRIAIVTRLDLRGAAGLAGQWANSQDEVRIVDRGGGRYDATFAVALIGWPKTYCGFTARFETKRGAIVADQAVSTLAPDGLPTGPLTTHIELMRDGATLHAVETGGATNGKASPHTCGYSNVDTRYGPPMFHLTQTVRLIGTGPH